MNDQPRRVVLKFALVVINLVFFATQLSYKFYACASVPVRQSMEWSPTRIAGLSARSLVRGAVDSKFLSLDKRYDSKHIFALLPLFQGIDPPPGSSISARSKYRELLLILPVLIPSQRGPPAA